MDNCENRVDDLDEIKTAVVRISLVLEQQQKDAVKRDEILEKHIDAINTISNDVKETKRVVSDLECTVANIQTKFQESESKNIITIDTREVNKKAYSKFILPAGVILAALSSVVALIKAFF